MTTLPKLASEVRTFFFDFSKCAEFVAGDTLASATVTCSPAGLTLGSVAIASPQAKCAVSSGAAGTTYLLTCLGTTAAGSVVAVQGQVAVGDLP